MLDTGRLIQQIYGNEAEVGTAIQQSKVSRQELFLTTKIWTENYAPERMIASLKDSLHKLQTDAVNLTLIHWPAPVWATLLLNWCRACIKPKLGLTEHIGVSNFNIAQTEEAIAAVGPDQIVTNQIELSPYLQNRTLVQYLQSQNIQVTSYMTLAYGKVLQDPVLMRIAALHEASTAQIALAWAMQQGFSVIPSSTKREHLLSNLEAQKILLSHEEMQKIAELERNGRKSVRSS